MTFLSILCALLIEQFRPLRADNPIYDSVRNLATRMEGWFNAGRVQHGQLAWFAMMALLVLPTALVYWLCARLSPILALCWNILIVYLTLGFRHYSHNFTSIQLALDNGDEASARRLLADWIEQDTSTLSGSDISRIAIETALVATHRNVFGVFFWFLMPIGPAGAVLYRVADYLARGWNESLHMRNEAFGVFAAKAFYWIDWIPVRLTAVAFAVVGNFEDAIYAWRNFADRWSNQGVGILLATGSGAMNVRLGSVSAARNGNSDGLAQDDNEPDIIPGEESTSRALHSAVGLVWRALLLWMLLLLMISIAVWLG